MGVRAKMWVEEKSAFEGQGSTWKGWKVKLTAALGKANEKWATASPSAEFTIIVANEEAAKEFVVGEYVYIDVTAPFDAG